MLVGLWEANYRVYGARKLWKAARRAGNQIGRDQGVRLMRAAGICGATRRRRLRTTRPDPEAARPADLVCRDITAEAPVQMTVIDWADDCHEVGTHLPAPCHKLSGTRKRAHRRPNTSRRANMRHHQEPPDSTRPRRSRWLAAVAVTAAAAIAVNATAAGAQTATQQPVDIAVASYAVDYGVSHSEARTRSARIDSLQELMKSIRDLEAERLAGWGIDHHGRFTAWVQLTGSVPASADAGRIAAGHADLEIRTGAAHTYAELLSGQRQLMSLGAIGRTDEPSGGPSPLKAWPT